MTSDLEHRVRYRESQPLRAGDLNAEQAYRIGMRRRHNIAHHGWGIIAGLTLVLGSGDIVVQPGMAVDGYGRELVVPQPLSIAFDLLGEIDGDDIHLWLVYHRIAETPPQRGRWDCGPGQYSRWREETRLRVTWGDVIDPRRPVEVPREDLDFGSHEPPPDDPDRAWPVYLGRIIRTSSGYEVDRSKRPYATLVGRLVSAPSTRARMQVDAERADDRQRFAVSLRDDEGDALKDRFTIDREGDTTLRGHVSVEPCHPLVMTTEPGAEQNGDSGRIPECVGHGTGPTEERPAWGIHFEPMKTPPEEAAPWQIYHTLVERDEVEIHQLRLEIFNPGGDGDPSRHKFVIGRRGDGCTFAPCLSVTADCTVTIHGDLEVDVEKGQLIEGPIDIDPSDPDFVQELTKRWSEGLVTGVDTLLPSDLQISVDVADTTVVVGDELEYTVEVRNTGDATLTGVVVYENLILGEEVVRSRVLVQNGVIAAGEQIIPEDTSYGPDQAGELRLMMSAVGFGPASIGRQASAEATVQVQSPPDGLDDTG